MKPKHLFPLFALLFSVTAWAGQQSEIQLKDGSRIYGEITSVSGDRYTVRNDTLGTLSIDGSHIELIRPATTGGNKQRPTDVSSPNAGVLSAAAKSLNNNLSGDPQVMAIIESLQSDPQFQAAINDPALMSAIRSGNYAALLANPKFQTLMDHNAVKRIEGMIQH